MEKSHVSLATNFCPVCGEEFKTNELLLETRISAGKLMQTLDRTTCTGVELCEKHKEMVDSGEYTAFFVTQPRDCGPCKYYRYNRCKDAATKRRCNDMHYKAEPSDGEAMYVYRTGAGFMLRRHVVEDMFGIRDTPVVHCDPELFDAVLKMVKQNMEDDDE